MCAPLSTAAHLPQDVEAQDAAENEEAGGQENAVGAPPPSHNLAPRPRSLAPCHCEPCSISPLSHFSAPKASLRTAPGATEDHLIDVRVRVLLGDDGLIARLVAALEEHEETHITGLPDVMVISNRLAAHKRRANHCSQVVVTGAQRRLLRAAFISCQPAAIIFYVGDPGCAVWPARSLFLTLPGTPAWYFPPPSPPLLCSPPGATGVGKSALLNAAKAVTDAGMAAPSGSGPAVELDALAYLARERLAGAADSARITGALLVS